MLKAVVPESTTFNALWKMVGLLRLLLKLEKSFP